MKYDPEEAIQKIIQLRESRGLSITQVAKGIGYTEPNYSKIESRKIKLNLNHLLKFVDYYKVDLSIFFDGAEPCADRDKCQKIKDKFPFCYNILDFCYDRLEYSKKDMIGRIIRELEGIREDIEIEERLGKKLKKALLPK